MATRMKFVIHVAGADDPEQAGKIEAHLAAAKLRDVVVVRESEGFEALVGAVRGKAPAGMPGMMGRPPRIYVLRPAFASSNPSAFLPAVYRHGDPDLHIRAGVGCLDLAAVIAKRIE